MVHPSEFDWVTWLTNELAVSYPPEPDSTDLKAKQNAAEIRLYIGTIEKLPFATRTEIVSMLE